MNLASFKNVFNNMFTNHAIKPNETKSYIFDIYV